MRYWAHSRAVLSHIGANRVRGLLGLCIELSLDRGNQMLWRIGAILERVDEHDIRRRPERRRNRMLRPPRQDDLENLVFASQFIQERPACG